MSENVRYGEIREERERMIQKLFASIKENKDVIHKLYEANCGHVYEDRIYRFYHYSFKVFYLQDSISDIVQFLEKINPRPIDCEHRFNKWFSDIVEGAKKEGEFKMSYNKNFPSHARPIVEASFHCKYFVDMLGSIATKDESPDGMISSAFAAVLELYNLR
jgi:hypothetical protein